MDVGFFIPPFGRLLLCNQVPKFRYGGLPSGGLTRGLRSSYRNKAVRNGPSSIAAYPYYYRCLESVDGHLGASDMHQVAPLRPKIHRVSGRNGPR